MEDKGLIAAKESHGLKIYAAVQGKVQTLSRLMKDFAAQVLDLDGPLSVTAFANSPLLDEKDLEDLEELLREEGES
jgi:predicted transcriptional regulator